MRFLALITFIFSFDAFSEVLSFSGKVEKLRSFSSETTVDGGAVRGVSWLKLTNLDSAGQCPSVGSHGYIFYIRAEDKDLLSIGLAVQMAGKVVEVTVNDAKRLHNACVVEALSVL